MRILFASAATALLVALTGCTGGGGTAAPSPTLAPTGTPGGPAPATPVATGTPTPTQPAINGVPLKPMTMLAPAEVPAGWIVYFTELRPQSETLYTKLWRAYRDGSGTLVFDDLSAPLRAHSEAGLDPYSVAMSADGSTIVAAVCPGVSTSCGVGIRRNVDAEAVPVSLQAGATEGLVFRSTDGGITWDEDGALPAGARFVGWWDGRTLVAGPGDGNAWNVWWFETGEAVKPPAEGFYPSVLREWGVVWSANSTEPSDTLDTSTKVIHQAQMGTEAERLFWAEAGNGVAVTGYRKDMMSYVIGRFGSSDQLVTAWQTGFFLRLIPFNDPEFIGWGDWQTTSGERVFGPQLVDIARGTATPLLGLGAVVAMHMSPAILAVEHATGDVLRVVAPGGCVDMRAEPGSTGGVWRCLADGVVLRAAGPAEDGWVPVVPPGGGAAAWAAEAFLAR